MTGLIVFGTRPEAVKLAPLVAVLAADEKMADFRVVSTGQHSELMSQTLQNLDLSIDTNFNLMTSGQTPMQVVERTVAALNKFYGTCSPPDWVLVQGDTATAYAGSQFGYLSERPVIHLEAGLRTYDEREPWPEEMFRQLIARLAVLHLAPYPRAHENLLREGIEARSIRIVGNPGLDTQDATMQQTPPATGKDLPASNYFLVTLHRRENLDARLEATCRNLESLLAAFPGKQIVWPVHPNPMVRETAFRYFGDRNDRVHLCEPLDYPIFLLAQAKADLVISDSGGVQEEAASLGTPVAIIREKSERLEAIDLGLTRIAGADARDLGSVAAAFLSTPPDTGAVAKWRELQGNGRAAIAAAAAIREYLGSRQGARRQT